MKPFFSVQRILVSSQILFGLASWLFMFLIPDIAQKQNKDKEQVWIRVYMDGIFVLPLCIWIKIKTGLTNSKGFTCALILEGASLLLMGFGQYEKNTSPLLYCLIYRVFNGCGWVFATYHGLAQIITKKPKKIDQIFSQFSASFILGTILAPFLGYLTCNLNYFLLFSLAGLIVLAYSVAYNFILSDSTEQDLELKVSISTLLRKKPFIFSLFIQSAPFISIAFVFTSTLSYLDSLLSFPDMALECIFLSYKIPFFLSCIITPILLKSNSFIQKHFLTGGYLLSGIGFLLLLEQVNIKNPIVISGSLAALGTSSGFILSNFYVVPPLSKLLRCLQIHFNSIYSPAAVSEVLFFCTVLAYFCKFLGVILGGLALKYSFYSIPYLVFSCFFIILSLLSKYDQTFEIISDTTLIELIDVKAENLEIIK